MKTRNIYTISELQNKIGDAKKFANLHFRIWNGDIMVLYDEDTKETIIRFFHISRLQEIVNFAELTRLVETFFPGLPPGLVIMRPYMTDGFDLFYKK
jgi:hypothetical protein